MASPFTKTLTHSQQGAGYCTPVRLQGQIAKSNEDIPEEVLETDSDRSESAYTFADYKVQEHDTLYGIALSNNISPNVLKKDNELSSDLVYTGQIIKIRRRKRSEELLDITKKNSIDEELGFTTPAKSGKGDVLREVTLDGKDVKSEYPILNELTVLYCTSVGDIEGKIKVENSLLNFTPRACSNKPQGGSKQLVPVKPLGIKTSNGETEDKFAKFITCIDIRDIEECNVMAVPSPQCEEFYEITKEFAKDYLLQVILKRHGTKSMGKYFDHLISKLEKNGTPYSCVYFKIHSRLDLREVLSNKAKHRLVLGLQNGIHAAKALIQDPDQKSNLTRIPYFEFLYDKFDHKDAELLRKAMKKTSLDERKSFQEQDNIKALSNRGFFTRKIASVFKKVTENLNFGDDSQILDKDQFSQLIHCVPHLYQALDWKLVYSTKLHGTSFNNMLRRTGAYSPILFVIKDENGFAFGAYFSHRLKMADEYYGCGETFLYTFRDLEDISTFYWSKKNSLFFHMDMNGITIGAGPNYGLWINNDLTHGRSYKCETFNNPELSLESEFQIIKMEVWAVNEESSPLRGLKTF